MTGAAARALDEETAWALVREAAAGRDASLPRRVRLPTRDGPWLDLHADGSWTASAPPDPAARDLLDLLLPLALPADLVVGQLGQSLDGRIATEGGDSHYVTGPADIRRLHRVRALVDAVVVGAATVALDDPRLTVREVEGENPVRVVLDPDGSLEPGRRVFADPGGRTLLVRGAHASAPPSLPEGVEVLTLPPLGRGFAPEDVLAQLRARGLRRVLVEGGGLTVSRFLEAGLLDRLHLTVAPVLIGSGRPSLTLPPIQTLAQALRPRCRCFRLGEDVLFDLDLR